MNTDTVPVLRMKSIKTGRRSTFNTRNVSPIQYRGAQLRRAREYDARYTTPKNENIGRVDKSATITAPTCSTLSRKVDTRVLLAHCYDAVQLALSSVPTSYAVVTEPKLVEQPISKPIGCETKPLMLGTAVKLSYCNGIKPVVYSETAY